MSRRVGPPPNAADPLVPAAERFRHDLTASLGDAVGPVLLAVSGGADSMAMLTLAADADLPGGVAVATVDHRLRTAAAAEAAMVAAYCARLGLSHTTLVPSDSIEGASLQAQARKTRYALLGHHARSIGAVAIATAHHVDDQAETFLMRAARGSGLAGLAGVRARTTIAGKTVVRPLLDWRRAELRAIVRRREVPFADDPTNRDPAHDRTRFRRLFDTHEWLGAAQIARSAAALADADADVRAMVDWLWTARAQYAAKGVDLDVADLPRELLRRLVRRGVAQVRATAAITEPDFTESTNVEPLLDALGQDRRATQSGVSVTPGGGRWRFRPAPARRGR
ncbi:tRNA lysidine(34) synthetase TilS [Sphingomonas oligophenolica]|uniref:tRNA(Ile)-lysidine synthase n=1 Tax=Sphingomonas oligophenolica TaxID=301154 RepID=A0A502CB28_9SPHN|nr:tRNA lysidine(34) synthetase TilS [Sphingomonas oligophenolica]TPG10387.1 tRNA lysidine(34) synthetase TilS [Sphingomonas oligophenolica]